VFLCLQCQLGIQALMDSDYDDYSSIRERVKKRHDKAINGLKSTVLFKSLCVGFISLCLWCLIPSQKDAAMIWVIPKLATVENVELLQGEAAEIYKLAKQALKESVGVEDEK
jgi:hypothetical protein